MPLAPPKLQKRLRVLRPECPAPRPAQRLPTKTTHLKPPTEQPSPSRPPPPSPRRAAAAAAPAHPRGQRRPRLGLADATAATVAPPRAVACRKRKLDADSLPTKRPPQPPKPKDYKQLQTLIGPLLDSEPVVVAAPVNGDLEADEISSDSDDDPLIKRSRARVRANLQAALNSTTDLATLLEDEAVTPTVRRQYEKAVEALIEWSKHYDIPLHPASKLDHALCVYMTSLFLRGHQAHVGERLFAGMMHVLPETRRHGVLLRASRALKGWRRKCPGFSRRPLPFCVWAAICHILIARNKGLLAAMVLMAFQTYMRPKELLGLRVAHLLPPTGSITLDWSVLIAAQELGIPTKTGAMDDSLLFDAPGLKWMDAIWRQLTQAPADELLFPVTYREWYDNITQSAALLGLQLVPYQLRHSGASHDRLKNNRPLTEVLKRGRWRSLKSVARYERHAAVGIEFRKLSAHVQDHCGTCESQLEAVFLGREPARLPPPLRR